MAALTGVSVISWIFTDSLDIAFISIASGLFYSTFLIINRLVYKGILNPAQAVASAWKLMILRVFTFLVVILSILGNIVACLGIYLISPAHKKGQPMRLACATMYTGCMIVSIFLLKANVVIWSEIRRRAVLRLRAMLRAWNGYYRGMVPGQLLDRTGANGRRIKVPPKPTYSDALTQVLL